MTITREQYQERVAAMCKRLEAVDYDQVDEAKAAVDEDLEALGIEVEALPIWEQRWIPVDAPDGGYYIYAYDDIGDEGEPRAVGHVTMREDKDFILGAFGLVKASLGRLHSGWKHDQTIAALLNMGVEVKK